MKTNNIIAIFCIIVLIISSKNVFALIQANKEKTSMDSIMTPFKGDGTLIAKLGIENETYINLKGSHQNKNDLIFCNGNATIKEKVGKFNGFFKENYFKIKIVFDVKSYLIIEGNYKFDENKEDFNGEWCNNYKDKND